VTTFLHQEATHPWTGGALKVDPATRAVTRAEADPTDDGVLARRILDAEIGQDASAGPLDRVVAVARALARPAEEEHRGGLHRTRGHRTRQRAGSPVPSSRFV
jgi:hypothetical protein